MISVLSIVIRQLLERYAVLFSKSNDAEKVF